jgi:hypothetical protein
MTLAIDEDFVARGFAERNGLIYVGTANVAAILLRNKARILAIRSRL